MWISSEFHTRCARPRARRFILLISAIYFVHLGGLFCSSRRSSIRAALPAAARGAPAATAPRPRASQRPPKGVGAIRSYDKVVGAIRSYDNDKEGAAAACDHGRAGRAGRSCRGMSEADRHRSGCAVHGMPMRCRIRKVAILGRCGMRSGTCAPLQAPPG